MNQWVVSAEEDYRNAEYGLTLEEDCPVGAVCFHSQQCVEKYLKALLAYRSLAVPEDHDLLVLYHLVSSNSRPELPEEWLAILNRYAVEPAYPDVISRPEAEYAFHIARAIRLTLRGELSRIMGGNIEKECR